MYLRGSRGCFEKRRGGRKRVSLEMGKIGVKIGLLILEIHLV